MILDRRTLLIALLGAALIPSGARAFSGDEIAVLTGFRRGSRPSIR